MKQIIDKWGRELTFISNEEWEEREEKSTRLKENFLVAYVFFAVFVLVVVYVVRL